MKISLNWLKDYVDLTGISTKEIVHKLTMAGLEVEEAVNEEDIYRNFIVASVKIKSRHPNADKLSLCIVSTGSGEVQVVCGAPNVAEGQKIVFAPVGTIIPKDGMEIKKVRIRGVESEGMICSQAELELGTDHSGIMVLPADLKEGTPITAALELNDLIMEIGITPNRPDALSHIGVARDLAALLNRKLKLPEVKIKEAPGNITAEASVEIIDTENCPRYSAKVIKGVEVRESPHWLKKRLEKIGLRPINNIVDITNYVLYETGQPLHAFDLDMLSGKKIIVQSTEKESIFTTLDSKERKLPPGTLMICDSEKPVAIAGIMGGENSEVTGSTKNILIESAHFNARSVRRTSKSLGLSTDASYRFERGVDPENTVFAADRAAQLMIELGGGKIIKGIIDVYPVKIERKEISLRFSRVKKILGYEIPRNKVKDIFTGLGLKEISENNSEIKVSIPGFRPDLEREVDLIEEVARIHGYENIPAISNIIVKVDKKKDDSAFADKIREGAVSLGLYEIVCNPLQSEEFSSLTGNPIRLMNPLSLDLAYLRTSLIPGALSIIAKNINNGEKDLALFELGSVFNKISSSDIKSFDDFTEKLKIIFILTGRAAEKEWHVDEKSYDFYYLKGLVDSFLYWINKNNYFEDTFYNSDNDIYDYYFSKHFNRKVLGTGGEVRKDVLKKFDIEQKVFCFEFEFDLLKEIEVTRKIYREPARFPKVIRDFAFIFDKSVLYSDIEKIIKSESEKSGSGLLKSLKLFDLFESELLGENKRSLAFSLEFQSDDRTLTEEEVDKEFKRLIESISQRFGAKLRGN